MFRLPPLYKENPVIWFAQMECAFASAGIQHDTEKYYRLMANADDDILTLISDIVIRYEGYKKLGYYGYESFLDVKAKVLDKFQTLGKDKFRALFKDDPISLEKRLVELEAKNVSLGMSIVGLQRKLDESTAVNVSLDNRIETVEERAPILNDTLRNDITKLQEKLDNYIASNSSVDERLKTLEDKVQNLIKNVHLVFQIDDFKDRMNKSIASINERLLTVEKKINKPCDSLSTASQGLLNEQLDQQQQRIATYTAALDTIISMENKGKGPTTIATIKEILQTFKGIDTEAVFTESSNEKAAELKEKLYNAVDSMLSMHKCLEEKLSTPSTSKVIEKAKKSAPTVVHEEASNAVKEKMKHVASKVSVATYVSELKQKIDDLIASNGSADERITALEEKTNDSTTKDFWNNHLTELRQKMENSQDVMSDFVDNLDKRIAALEKANDPAVNVFLEERMLALEAKLKDSFEERMLALEEKLKDSASQASLQQSVEDLKHQVDGLIASTGSIEKYVAELESKMVELLFLAP